MTYCPHCGSRPEAWSVDRSEYERGLRGQIARAARREALEEAKAALREAGYEFTHEIIDALIEKEPAP